jgi:hypothetical protein
LFVPIASAIVSAVLASSFAEASFAFFVSLRKDGIAIAARMPTIRITTSNSINVNPRSLLRACFDVACTAFLRIVRVT